MNIPLTAAMSQDGQRMGVLIEKAASHALASNEQVKSITSRIRGDERDSIPPLREDKWEQKVKSTKTVLQIKHTSFFDLVSTIFTCAISVGFYGGVAKAFTSTGLQNLLTRGMGGLTGTLTLATGGILPSASLVMTVLVVVLGLVLFVHGIFSKRWGSQTGGERVNQETFLDMLLDESVQEEMERGVEGQQQHRGTSGGGSSSTRSSSSSSSSRRKQADSQQHAVKKKKPSAWWQFCKLVLGVFLTSGVVEILKHSRKLLLGYFGGEATWMLASAVATFIASKWEIPNLLGAAWNWARRFSDTVFGWIWRSLGWTFTVEEPLSDEVLEKRRRLQAMIRKEFSTASSQVRQSGGQSSAGRMGGYDGDEWDFDALEQEVVEEEEGVEELWGDVDDVAYDEMEMQRDSQPRLADTSASRSMSHERSGGRSGTRSATRKESAGSSSNSRNSRISSSSRRVSGSRTRDSASATPSPLLLEQLMLDDNQSGGDLEPRQSASRVRERNTSSASRQRMSGSRLRNPGTASSSSAAVRQKSSTRRVSAISRQSASRSGANRSPHKAARPTVNRRQNKIRQASEFSNLNAFADYLLEEAEQRQEKALAELLEHQKSEKKASRTSSQRHKQSHPTARQGKTTTSGSASAPRQSSEERRKGLEVMVEEVSRNPSLMREFVSKELDPAVKEAELEYAQNLSDHMYDRHVRDYITRALEPHANHCKQSLGSLARYNKYTGKCSCTSSHPSDVYRERFGCMSSQL